MAQSSIVSMTDEDKNRINEWIKYSERRERYEKVNDSPAGGDVSDRLPFE